MERAYGTGYQRRSSSNRRGSRRSVGRSHRRNEVEGSSFGFWLLIMIVAAGAYVYFNPSAWVTIQQWLDKGKAIVAMYMPGNEVALPAERTPCTKANIAKIVAYTLLDEKTSFKTDTENIWYHKYYEALKQKPEYSFFKEEEAMQVMSDAEAVTFFKNILGSDYQINTDGQVASETQQPLTLKEFMQGYEQALQYKGKTNVLEYQTLSLLATSNNNSKLGAWQVLTDQGVFGFEGIILDPLVGYTVEAVIKDHEILGVIQTVSQETQATQAIVSEVSQDVVTLKIGSYEIPYKNNGFTASDVGKCFSVTLEKGTIKSYIPAVAQGTDRILRVSENEIELEKVGKVKGDEALDTASFYSGMQGMPVIKDNTLKSFEAVEAPTLEKVRVLLSEDGLGDYNQSKVQLSCSKAYKVMYGNEAISKQAGDKWDADEFSWENNVDKVTLVPEEGGAFTVTSLERQKINPIYQGYLEVYKEDKGYTLVNEVPLETYVATAIPSEMPTNYGLEAAKVQAVASRSFVKMHQTNPKFLKYGAQVDDTVSTQVYNNVAVNETAYEAAKATEGEVLKFNGRLISGNFFATSCGYTANYGETWSTGEIFPTNTPSYLVAKQQYSGSAVVKDMSGEKEASQFFKLSKEDLKAFDEESPWFRWQVKLTADELKAVINANIYQLTTKYPDRVKVLDEDKWVVGAISQVGKIKDLQVTQRGAGGNIMEMKVVGEDATIKVRTEYLVRLLLAPMQKDVTQAPIVVKRSDESEIQNMALLPSAFFTPEISKNDKGVLTEVTLYGGGFGHGVGMSQDGVKGMSAQGFDYKTILAHYYEGAEIVKEE